MSHILAVTTTYDDGYETAWRSPEQPGTAADAHDALAARWKAAGYTFTRDRLALTLVRRCDVGDLGPYVDTITHEDC